MGKTIKATEKILWKLRYKNLEQEIKEKILKISYLENRFLNIREVVIKLKEGYDIKRSPQVIKKYLEFLVAQKMLIRMENKPTKFRSTSMRIPMRKRIIKEVPDDET